MKINGTRELSETLETLGVTAIQDGQNVLTLSEWIEYREYIARITQVDIFKKRFILRFFRRAGKTRLTIHSYSFRALQWQAFFGDDSYDLSYDSLDTDYLRHVALENACKNILETGIV